MTPPRSYLDAHLGRTRQFLIERGLAKPAQPPQGRWVNTDLPSDLKHFLDTMK